MLSTANSNRVTFNVNVFGTAATPTVRCIVGEAPGFSFPATKLEDGMYEAIVNLPATLKPGSYPFKVEVLLNGRLFTPINHDVPVTGAEPAVEPPALNPTPNPVPTVEPAPAKAPVVAKESKKPGLLSGLEQMATRPVIVKPIVVDSTRPKISMAEIDASAARIEERQVKPAPKKAPVKVPESIVTTIPVSLTRGQIIYR